MMGLFDGMNVKEKEATMTEINNLIKKIMLDLQKLDGLWVDKFGCKLRLQVLGNAMGSYVKVTYDADVEELFSINIIHKLKSNVVISLKTKFEMPFSGIYDFAVSYEDNMGVIYSKLLQYLQKVGIKFEKS